MFSAILEERKSRVRIEERERRKKKKRRRNKIVILGTETISSVGRLYIYIRLFFFSNFIINF